MKIYEKIFARLNELHMSQTELSKRTGIATSTISDWRKKQINPQADKLSVICKALDMSLADLLCDKENTEQTTPTDYLIGDNYIMELFRESDADNKRRILRYFELLKSAMKSMIAVRQKRGSVMYQLFRILMGITL